MGGEAPVEREEGGEGEKKGGGGERGGGGGWGMGRGLGGSCSFRLTAVGLVAAAGVPKRTGGRGRRSYGGDGTVQACDCCIRIEEDEGDAVPGGREGWGGGCGDLATVAGLDPDKQERGS